MKDFTHTLFAESMATLARYYQILVQVTSNNHLVGSTNEWVLDNYYLISEQEKMMREELKDKELRRLPTQKKDRIREMLYGYLRASNFAVDKAGLTRHITQYQQERSDFFSYKEVEFCHLLMRLILIHEIGTLTHALENKLRASQEEKGDIKSSIDDSVAQNIKMTNLFMGLKAMDRLKMEELFERVSFTERLLAGEQAGIYSQMHDNNKGDYRRQLNRMARRQHTTEHALAQQLVRQADQEGRHVGWLLFPPKPYERRAKAYVAIVGAATMALAALTGWALHTWWAALLMVVPASQFVIELFNNLLYRLHKPVATFKLKFEKGIPEECATMVIMPTIVKNGSKVREMLDKLEVYYLSNKSDNLYFTLLGDASAESSEDMPFDEEVAREGAARARFLNEKHGKDIFHFVYRKRKWNEGEGQWLGLERKRGAILQLNDLLLGQMDEAQRKENFHVETLSAFSHPIKYVITLDTDTQLVLHSAFALIGAMAHPLNRPVLSEDGRKVVSGYGLMQPLVTVDVEVTNKSRYAQLFSGLGGLDVYSTASFELYQDIFNEGSFCGKGIYDLRVFQQVLKGTFPRNLILSHDLLEGCHVRAGLINDVELFDDNPSNYLDDAKRHHRWTRGDWQIIGWLRRTVRDEQGERRANPVNTIGKWKIFDNLRRSVTALALLALLFFGLAHTGIVGAAHGTAPSALWYMLITCVVIIVPVLFFIFGQMAHIHRFFNRKMKYYAKLLHGLYVVLARSFLQLAYLPKEALLYTDALVRATYRLTFSHRNLLNWVTSEDAARTTKRTLWAYCTQFWVNFVCAALLVALAFLLPQSTWVRACSVAVAAAWCWAPVGLFLLGRPFGEHNKLSEKEKEEVREWARRTWHFFDENMSEENNYLIPDNYQLNRTEKTDYKTSPTNIGYSLLAIVCAARLGHLSEEEAMERLEHVIDTVVRLPKWNGHLYNWYDIHTLEALFPQFVSTCDSGNFVACLYVVKGFLSLDDTDKTERRDPLLQKVIRLIDASDFSVFYNHDLDVFSIGYDKRQESLLPYHYNNYASEARLTSYLAIGKGDAPFKHWFCLDKTLIRYKGYKGVASWYGTLFEYFMPLIFLHTYRHTLMDETYAFAVMAQRSFGKQIDPALPWGISETAYHELDDAQNYKYQAFGVPYLKFQNTTPNRIVISPYSSLLAISVDARAVYQNMQKFKRLGAYDDFGFYESYDEHDHALVAAHFAHHQGMILASITNYLCDNVIQDCFHKSSQMRSIETLLKEKVQLQPYIDMQTTQYKRYTYNRSRQESDVREFTDLKPLPEIGILSNGAFTVLLNDRGGGFVRYKDIYVNRYRQISSEYYGCFMYIRDTATDKVWSNTYAPTLARPDSYRVTFASDRVKYLREDGGIVTTTEVCVASDRNATLQAYTFENHGDKEVTLELTTYSDIIICRKEDDIAHRVFNGMTIFSEFDPDSQSLVFSKKARGDRAKEYFVVNRLFFEHENHLKFEYETSRLHFIGRGGSSANPDVMRLHSNLSNTVGTTLDPIMSFRRQVRLAPGQSERVFQLIGFGKSREQVLKMARLYATPRAVKEVFDNATVFNNARIAMSSLSSQQMALYNSMSKYVYETASLGMERRRYMAQNTLSQRGLWRYGISGDLPILLLEMDKAEQFAFAKEMLQAFEYYKSRGLFMDLVIVNDEEDSHRETLRHAIDDYAGQLRTRRYFDNPLGDIHVLNGAEVGDAERNLLHSVARLWFSASTGISLKEQLLQMDKIYAKYQDKEHYEPLAPASPQAQAEDLGQGLAFYNRYGGFAHDGKEYVVTRPRTPMPWINVLTNPRFGCIVSSTMGGFTYAHNAQQFKVTAWHNDIVADRTSETLLVNHRQFIPSLARHGFGYSVFEGTYDGFSMRVTVFVARQDMTKFYLVDLTSTRDEDATLRCELVNKVVLGVTEEDSCRYLISHFDEADNALYVRNTYGELHRDEHAFFSSTEPIAEVDILSPNRKTVRVDIALPAHGSRQWAFMLGVKGQEAPLRQWDAAAIANELQEVKDEWQRRLGVMQVGTPDNTLNYMLNGWYLYQTYSARLYGRVGFYQVGGATGYRDQLQDVMSVLYSDPAYARQQILTHAAHQFPEGDVLHWWHDDLLFGSRTTCSDDYLWLVYVTYQYLRITGDRSILHEEVPFVQGEALKPGEAERGMGYTLGHETQPLIQHLRLCIDKALRQKGIHQLPLMGCGDWNDGMNHVGTEGKGESVWVGFFLVDVLRRMEKIALWADQPDYAQTCHDAVAPLQEALRKNAWDGAWYLRAYFDNGDALGSRNNMECQIDLISQAWSLLTDTATPEQKPSILTETERRLVDHENDLIRLLSPAFKHSADDPGYIMTYMEGIRENGGQYTHAAMWWIMALLHERRTDQAYAYYAMINPANRAATLSSVLKYKVEPYCIAADIYSSRQHGGRGGWTWYTGSASWAYKVGIEGILGFHKQGDTLTVEPQAPSTWDSFKVTYRHGTATYRITVALRSSEKNNTLQLVDDGETHDVTLHC